MIWHYNSLVSNLIYEAFSLNFKVLIARSSVYLSGTGWKIHSVGGREQLL